MKYLLSAITLVIATPAAAAQTAPAPQHQGHGQHQEHGQHQGQAEHQQHSGQPGHAPQGDCCADRNGNGRMDCCEGIAQAGDRRSCCAEPAPATAAQPQGHQGH